MYALIYNNEIKAGPREWNKRVFEYEYNALTDQTANLPSEWASTETITVDANTKIIPVYFSDEVYNPKIEQPAGPTLTLYADHVDAHMGKVDKDIEQVKRELKAKVAELRWLKETAGLDVDGSIVKTDRESQGTLSGAVSYVELDPTTTVTWKTENGWVELNRTQIEAMALAVASHVQACFSQEKAYGVQIDACTTLAELDALEFTF